MIYVLSDIHGNMKRFDSIMDQINLKSEDTLLVHGSPIENYSWIYREYETAEKFAVWERWNICDPIPEGYTLIFGHTPTVHFQDNDPLEIWKSERAIGIDCGSGYPNSEFEDEPVSRLSCLRIDDMTVFYSKED